MTTALKDALLRTENLSHSSRPPNLREARGRDRCGTCAYWKPKGLMSGAGACRLYAGFPTHEGDVSDSYKKGK